MNAANILKYVLAALPVLAYLFGAGDGADFASADAVGKFIASHFPQLAGVAGVISVPLFYAVKWLHDFIDSRSISKALENGKLDIGDVIGAVDDSKGSEVGTYVKSALADTAFVTLFHACDFDAELTGKLNEAHSLYRVKRAVPVNV